jgi:alpha-N-arabinofuranosidase
MTETARLKLDPAFAIGPVDPRLYGGFVEHMGRGVYTGLYEPSHPTADEHGFRADVADLVREIGMPVMRYPGGNFVSQYDWEDGIGPKAQRPARLDLAWKASEPNQVGVDEYMTWCASVGTEPIMAVNLGTRGAAEARDLVEYCNFPSDSTWAQRRADNGHTEPYGVKLWCLGNEMDGPWQACAKTPTEYGRLARESAKLMRWVDESIELVVCGSSNGGMATFGQWEWEVLGHTHDQVDYLAIHSYFGRGRTEESFRDYLASPERMSRFIGQSVSLCDAVGAKLKSDKRLQIAFDEWNVTRPGRGGEQRDRDADRWAVGRRLAEMEYDVADAVVFGGLLVTLLQHADRVTMGCLAQTVNILAPIMTEPGGPAWRQTIFHPFALTSRLGRGTSLRVAGEGPSMATASVGDVPCLLAAAVHDEPAGALSLFLVNRDPARTLAVDADLSATGVAAVGEAWYLHEEDSSRANTLATPDAVAPKPLDRVDVQSGRLRCELPAMSWTALRLSA